MDCNAQAAAESVARTSYGRLLAYLTLQWRDLPAAEDALSEAFAAALSKWPQQGVPASPEGWLLTVARRKLIDESRRNLIFDPLNEGAIIQAEPSKDFPDERLRLMLICAHPAIDIAIRPALILQTVLGLEARIMAPAFLIPPDTLTKRLTRAKKKIRDSGMGYERPAPQDMPDRLNALLEATYAAYFLGGQTSLLDAADPEDLRSEAVYLARLIASLVPESAEALGFLALLCFCQARRPAQTDPNGDFIPLLDQKTELWDSGLMKEGYTLLANASEMAQPGPFQIEASIHAAHCYRAFTGVVPWPEIASLYDTLVDQHPTVGSLVGRAVAHASQDPARGLKLLDDIDPDLVRNYQSWWLARGYVLEMLGQLDLACLSLERGLGLTTDPGLRRYLSSRLSRIKSASSPERRYL
jgi:RNA polymerase sigma-70 factor (ECF subfamily)